VAGPRKTGDRIDREPSLSDRPSLVVVIEALL
jgi:hypothetical protein